MRGIIKLSLSLLESLRMESDKARREGRKEDFKRLRDEIDNLIFSLQASKKIKVINIEKFLNQKEEGY